LERAAPRPGASLRNLLLVDAAKPVMAGVNPVIHPSSNGPSAEAMDPRVTPGGDASRKPGDPFASRDLNVVRLIRDRVILTGTTSNARSGSRPSRADGEIISAVAGALTVTKEGTKA
jgi:peptide/nickel transport system ATP-binding protein